MQLPGKTKAVIGTQTYVPRSVSVLYLYIVAIVELQLGFYVHFIHVFLFSVFQKQMTWKMQIKSINSYICITFCKKAVKDLKKHKEI